MIARQLSERVTLLSPAAEMDSATAATSALPIVETAPDDAVPDDASVLVGDATCAPSADTASATRHRPIDRDTVLSRASSPVHPQIRILTSTLFRLVSLVCTN
jgi:hypothetical protein